MKKGRNPNSDSMSKKMMQRMAFVLFCFIGIGFTTLGVRLYIIQIQDHEFYQAKAINQQMRDTTIAPNRGTIYDRNMKTLALSATTEVISIAPKSLDSDQIDLVARELSTILDVSYDSIIEKANTNTYYQLVKRQVEKDVADEVRQFISEYDVSGINIDADSKRYYPYGDFASHIIGFTNVDGVGIEGVEAYYDDILIGTPGRIVSAKNALSMDMPFRYEQYIDAQDGYNLVLTLDEVIQHFLEKHLEAAAIKYNVQDRATVIAMDVNTGDILGLAVYPDYDLNSPRDILDEEMSIYIDSLSGSEKTDAQLAYWQELWRNKAIADTYEPGSTFKAFTAAMSLEENAIDPSKTLYCPGYRVVAGIRINCWKGEGHGALDLEGALQNSCNPYMMNIADSIGGQTFYDYVKAFGFLEKTGIDLYGEAVGIFHQERTIVNGPVELAVSSFGQTFKVTPISLLTGFSSLVNGGYLVTPRVADKVVDDDGTIISVFETEVKRQVISEEVSEQMSYMLETVVSEGTGKNAYLMGYTIGGKTATSEKIDEKNEEGEVDKFSVSFVGFAPAEDPEIALLLMLDEPDVEGVYISGGVMAAPVIGDMFEDILPYIGIAPQYTEEQLAQMEKPVPSVIDLTVEDARKIIQENSFNPVVMGEGAIVIEQVPHPQQTLGKDGKVILYTEGAGENMVNVPSVEGESLSNAISILENAGFNVRIEGDDSDYSREVTTQSPTAGTLLAEGSVIVVEVIFDTYSDWAGIDD